MNNDVEEFQADVRFTTSGLDRLQAYASHFHIISQHINPPRGVLEERFAGFRGVVHYSSEGGEDEEQVDGEMDEDQDEPG